MKITLFHRPSGPASASPYRLLDEQEREVECIRQLSPRSLRAYAYDLLHFARWLEEAPQPLPEITESTLLDYVRHQLDQEPKPAPQTVNHRLGVLRCLYRFHYGQEIPAGQSHFQRAYTKRSPLGYGRPRPSVYDNPGALLCRSRRRWSAFLRSIDPSARGPPTGRGANAGSRQRKQKARFAVAAGDRRSRRKISAAGKAASVGGA